VVREKNIRIVAVKMLNINTLMDFIKIKNGVKEIICQQKYRIKAEIC